MQAILADGSTVTCSDTPFAEGGDGILFFSSDGVSVIKLYKTPEPWRIHATEAVLNRFNAVKEHTYWEQFFAWPNAMVIKPSVGIRMRKIAEQRPMSHFVNWKFRSRLLQPQDRGSWQGYVAAAIKVARLVKRLHQFGLCHSDLSENNIFLNPVNGQVTLLDCDGLVVPDQLPPVVIGTRGYMAPEIVTGAAAPSIDADLHALAVVIYRLLFIIDPFRGPKKHHNDPAIDDELMYGQKALFIEHPTDHSNRPASNFPSTRLLGEGVHKLFQRTFVEHLKNPSRRPRAAEWERALIQMYDRIVPCANPTCVFKSFALLEQSPCCPWCKTPMRHPSGQIPLLHLYKKVGKTWDREGSYTIIGSEGRTLHTWHANSSASPGPTTDAAVQAQIMYDSGSRTWRINNYNLRSLSRMTSPPQREPLGTGFSHALHKGDMLILDDKENARIAYVDFLRLP
ncbi:protein kinase domain-containing protein [Candidatus Chloroploca asiatica]|uniref:Protein kinase domain-containing protein n=1 Tax=Candidatus Chloroploca asiatica TaxID=1506545 RepID=A0A2H3KI30_9CHLR|nr:hypothetical protein [Candidatus Chloroploca asiatica]PDV97460.1 hypothetical protein A9Q02_22495 [Candidatus Chloroploca asiatica]